METFLVGIRTGMPGAFPGFEKPNPCLRRQASGGTLFMAFTILSALGHGANGIQEIEKPTTVSRPAVVVQKAPDDYRVIRERNRFVTDLVDDLSRTVSRLAR